MEVLVGAAGILLLLVATVDSLWTTLWTDGGGAPLTAALSRGLWTLMMALPSRVRRPLLSIAGPLLLLLAVGVWVALLTGGWWLLFLTGDTAVVDATTRVPADALTRLYYVGFGLFTLGVGDYVAHGDPWQLATVVMTGSGLFLVTLSITYLVQVVSAVVDKRAFASAVKALGAQPHEIVTTSWDGSGFPGLSQQLVQLSAALGRLSEQHLAYPVLHYFHARDPEKASALGIATLDEGLTLLAFAVEPGARPPPAALTAARRTIASFLKTVAVALPGSATETPPPPDLGRVRDAGIPTVDDRDFAASLVPLVERRRRLRFLVVEDGWSWPGVG